MDNFYHFNVNIHEKFPIQIILMLSKFSHVIIVTYNFEFVTVDQSRHWRISDYQHLPKDECDLGAGWLLRKNYQKDRNKPTTTTKDRLAHQTHLKFRRSPTACCEKKTW